MESVRIWFPSVLKNENICFFNNAEHTQVPYQVIEKTRDYLLNHNFPIDGTFSNSFSTNILLQNVRLFVDLLINNNKSGKTVFGSSVAQLAFNLSNVIPTNLFQSVIICDFMNESVSSHFIRYSNDISCWSHSNSVLNYSDLFTMIDDKTTMIILPHVSHVTGMVLDIKHILNYVRKFNENIKVLVDGTSFVPHRMMNVEQLDVDYYLFSFSEFLSVDLAVVYIKDYNETHFQTMEMGNQQQMNMYALLGLIEYMKDVCCVSITSSYDNTLIHKFYNKIYNCEEQLVKFFNTNIKKFKQLCYLINDYTKDTVPIFALYFHDFTHEYVTLFLNECNILCKYGTFNNTLIFDETHTSVVRISLTHYNTIHELEYFFNLLTELSKVNDNQSFFSNLFVTKPLFVVKTPFIDDVVKDLFNSLSKDIYYPDGNRYRLYSMVYTKMKTIVGNNRYLQSRAYEVDNEDVQENQLRHYQPVNMIDTLVFEEVLNLFSKFVYDQSNNIVNYIFLHQIRVVADKEVLPFFDKIRHHSYIGLLCVNRVNLKGGTISLYDNTNCNRCFHTVLNVGMFVMFNDKKILHDVSYIEPIDISETAYMDLIVMTTVF